MLTRKVPEPLHEWDNSLQYGLEIAKNSFVAPFNLVFDPERDAAERSLHEFIRQGWHVLHPEPKQAFIDGWPVHAVCEALEAVSNLQIRDLLVTEPPGYQKSLTICVFWEVWKWIKDPSFAWLNITYSDENAIRDSNRCRDLIKSPWFQERWGNVFKIRRDQDSAGIFYNIRGGYRVATSVAGGGTGKRADCVVGDDLMKIEEFDSKAARDHANKFWDQTVTGRARDPKTFCRVIVAQRGHQNDPPGHVLAQGDFTHVNIPMRFVPSKKCFVVLQRDKDGVPTKTWEDPRTEEGQLAWPERFPEDEVAKMFRIYGSSASGILQQDPVPDAEGAIFIKDDTRYFDIEELEDGKIMLVLEPEPGRFARIRPEMCSWLQTVDTAMKTEEHNDFTVTMTFGIATGGYVLIWHVMREKIKVPYQYDRIIGQLVYAPPGCKITYQAVEDKVSGTGILQEAAMRGTPMVALKADVNKKRRAANASVLHRSHQLLLRKNAYWLPDMEMEMYTFDKGEHDDQIDCLSHGANLAKEDALLHRGAGELALYPNPVDDQSRKHPIKREPKTEILPAGGGDIVTVAGVEMYFDD